MHDFSTDGTFPRYINNILVDGIRIMLVHGRERRGWDGIYIIRTREEISVEILELRIEANPDELWTFGRDTFPRSPPKEAELVVICRSDEGSLHRPPVPGWFANELNLTKGNSFTGPLSIVVIQRHGRDLWTLISVEDRRIVSTNGRVRQTNCAISRGSLLPTPIFLPPLSSRRPTFLLVVSLVFRCRAAPFHPFFDL